MQEAEKKLQEVVEKLQELGAREAELVARASARETELINNQSAREAELVARAAKLAAMETELINQRASINADRVNVDARISNAHQTAEVPNPAAKATRKGRGTNAERGSQTHNRWVRAQRDKLIQAFEDIFGQQWHYESRSSTKVR